MRKQQRQMYGTKQMEKQLLESGRNSVMQIAA